jgi:hypothetical protein
LLVLVGRVMHGVVLGDGLRRRDDEVGVWHVTGSWSGVAIGVRVGRSWCPSETTGLN